MTWYEKVLPSRINTERRTRSVPEGLWIKCPQCSAQLYRAELERNLHVCPKCSYHMRLVARDRLMVFLDPGSGREIAEKLSPHDPLRFKDSKPYRTRITQAQKETGERDALVAMTGLLKGQPVVACAFEFRFMGGSMGSVVGEKFARAAVWSRDNRQPLISFSASGGARMQEALYSLLQMAKTSAALAELAEARVPYISVLTDPTTGGVSASLAMLGDVNIAEPNALIGFAGPRVIQQTVRETLPEGFQRSEFLLEHGALDMLVDRRQMRDEIASLLAKLLKQAPPPKLQPESMARPVSVADWLRWQESLHPLPIDMGLTRVHDVLGRLGLQPPDGRVIAVGGTNGKGSTITLLHDCLRAAGGTPGLFTSPHLVRYNERIRIADQPVTDEDLVRAFERVEAARGSVPLTYFEFGTLAALASFAEAGCDTWLLEVGLGGRLDAVNALDADMALITTIGLDHQEWLGDSIEAIAAEKAGILRGGSLAFYGDSPLPEAIRARAESLGADLQIHGKDFGFVRDGAAGVWHWYGDGKSRRLDGLLSPAHWTAAQFRNATLALAALTHLIPTQQLTAAVINPVLLRSSPPGRFQVVRREHEWILDVAHNPQAAAVLREQLYTLALPPGGLREVTVVTALLADKAIADFVTELVPVAGRWIVSGVDDPRASSEARMREAMREAGARDVTWIPTPAGAFDRARQVTAPGGRIVVCGSFRIVAPALQWLGL